MLDKDLKGLILYCITEKEPAKTSNLERTYKARYYYVHRVIFIPWFTKRRSFVRSHKYFPTAFNVVGTPHFVYKK